MQAYHEKCSFFKGVNAFWLVQKNKPVIDETNTVNKRRKTSSILTFDMYIFYTKLPNELLIELNCLIDFCCTKKGKDILWIY